MAVPAILGLLPLLLLSAAAASAAASCAGRVFARNRVFAECVDLPELGSALHYTYGAADGELSLAFTATPPPDTGGRGWVSWGINPEGPRMVGAQAIVGYARPDGSVAAATWNVSSYRGAAAGLGWAIAYEVEGLQAERGEGGEVRLFARVRLPAGTGRVYHVWQVGPMDGAGGEVGKHAFERENLMAKGDLDLAAGRNAGEAGGDGRIRRRNIHGVLNAVSWGILLPVGAIIARYLQTFKSADPAWFYLHVSCQVGGYVVGVAGWGMGLKLGSESKGVQYSTHRSIGIAMFCLGTIQMFALLLRPKKDHKYRPYWRAYHLSMGYIVIILGIFNIFKGLEILSPNRKWKTAFITIMATLGCIAALLEALTWFVVLRRKPNSLQSNGHDKQKPLTPI